VRLLKITESICLEIPKRFDAFSEILKKSGPALASPQVSRSESAIVNRQKHLAGKSSTAQSFEHLLQADSESLDNPAVRQRRRADRRRLARASAARSSDGTQKSHRSESSAVRRTEEFPAQV